MEDAVASWLVRSSSDQSVWGQGDIVFCSWVGHFILTVPLSIQVYKIMGTSKFNAGINPAIDYHPIQLGVEILLLTSCYRNRGKLQPDRPLGLYADLTVTGSLKTSILSEHHQMILA